MTRALLTLIAVAGCACSDPRGDDARLASLAAAVESFDGELQDTEARVRSLSSEMREIAEAYDEVSSRYRDAREHHAAVKASSTASAEMLEEATASWESTAASWRFYRMVLKIAISIDRARADVSRQMFSCEPVSTASFRRTLIARGISLLGKDIDHIVPRSLGGADHPSNYQVLDSSLNRSLGSTWNVEKCAMAGDQRCAEAVAVSTKCGAYRGGF